MRWKWNEHRALGIYEELLILQSAVIPFSVWLFRYPKGAYSPIHDDLILGYNHYCINIELQRAECGGRFGVVRKLSRLDKFERTWFNRITWFRPDKLEHYVSRVEEGTRYVLSISWI